MHILSKAVVVAAGALAFAASAASAEIVCNDEGECWHAKRSDFKPEFKLQVHPDNWKWGTSERFKWREHEGRGYWRGGKWIDIR